MTPIPQDLIESALALTSKTMEDMFENQGITHENWNIKTVTIGFSYPNFFYYLLSPEFIEKYTLHTTILADNNDALYYIREFWWAIFEYQCWRSESIISLLTKI
jgi:hypothetical protein